MAAQAPAGVSGTSLDLQSAIARRIASQIKGQGLSTSGLPTPGKAPARFPCSEGFRRLSLTAGMLASLCFLCMLMMTEGLPPPEVWIVVVALAGLGLQA
jgi:hypothetical protein